MRASILSLILFLFIISLLDTYSPDAIQAVCIVPGIAVHQLEYNTANYMYAKIKELTINERKIPRLEASNFLGSPITEGSDSGAGSPTSQIKSAFHIMKRYKHLVYFGALSDDEMVAVEVSPASLKEKLPPSFRKVFGRK